MSKKVLLLAILTFISILIGSVIIYFYYNFLPVGKSIQDRFFEISEGQSSLEIGKNLQEKGFIRSSWFFAFYIKLTNKILLPGIYYLRENMNLAKIVAPLSQGNVQEYKITIPEGWTNKQIAEYLENKKIVSKDEFLFASEKKEGYLFPDTYRLAVDVTTVEIVTKMEENFAKRTEGLNLTSDDLILASIVEKEAKTEEDRAKIADIFKRRLENNLPLQSCATVNYAMGVSKIRLNDEDIKYDSPYNTYLYKGLPPAPIGNPGLQSIKSVLHTQANDYWYFLSDKDGNIHYAKTQAEHQQNKEKYL